MSQKKIYFVGAGPGDVELITIKGRRLLNEADCIVYAGSLINVELLTGCKADLHDSAGMNLEEILQALPTHMETLWSLFQLQLAQRQWSNGEDTITRMEKAGGSPYQIHLAKGLIFLGRRQWDQAQRAFLRAQQSNPEALPPLVALNNVYFERKQPEQAKNFLKKMVAEHPKHPYAWGMLGAVLAQLKENSPAVSAYQRQTETYPDWVEPWKDWAVMQWAQGQKSEALNIITRGLSHHPQSPVLLHALASFYQDDGQFDLAIQQYEAILAHSPHDISAANNLAYLLADKKGDSQSLETALGLVRRFEHKTQNPFLLDTVAWVYYKMGLTKEAMSVLKKALAKAPDHGLMNYHYGLLAFKAGDRVTAHKHLEKAAQQKLEMKNKEDVHRLLAELQL